jgi:aminopeptidase-like protein
MTQPVGSSLVDLASRLFPYDYSVTGSANDASAALLNGELPFATFEYASGSELNGWRIPHECIVEAAELWRNGHLVYDAKGRPLSTVAQSDSFVGTLPLEELRSHLFSADGNPAATPYHWSRLYRPDESIWGFCLPQSALSNLSPGDYTVRLVTRKRPSTMKVFVHTLEGTTGETILFNAHNCHPFQANDDISGIVVGIEVMKRLAELPARRFTYALMVAPELFGPMFWLNDLAGEQVARIKGTVMLKSVGNRRALRLQESFTGQSSLDLAAHRILKTRYKSYEHGAFRAIYGNDETVFEANPYLIPSISLTRWPFPEYHTDLDNPKLLSEDNLQDTVTTAVDICRALEMNIKPRTVSKGLVCLSRYGLYRSVPAVGDFGVDYSSEQGRWNRLMNLLPRTLDGNTGLLDIATRFDLPIEDVYLYVKEWIKHGLAV